MQHYNNSLHRQLHCSPSDGIHRFLPESVDATLLTHIVYAFVKVEVTAKGLYNLALSEWNDKEMIQRLHAHARKQNPDVKILVAVGGYSKPKQQCVVQQLSPCMCWHQVDVQQQGRDEAHLFLTGSCATNSADSICKQCSAVL